MPPRDFKQRPQRPRRRPAPARQSGGSRWGWFGAGACVGAAAAAALLLYEPGMLDGAGASRTATKAAGARESAPAHPRFEFYTMLPEKEIAVPETALDAPAPRPERADEPAAPAARYLLQVGSFRKLEDADRLKARLAFLGLEASIQTVSIDGTETWHRVRVGPYESRADLGEARARLRENELDALVLKLK